MKIFLVWTLILVASSLTELATGTTLLSANIIRSKAGFLKSLVNDTLHETPETQEKDVGPLSASHALWKGQSGVPKWIQYMLALTWVTGLGSLPCILPLVDNRPVTVTQMLLAASTIFVTFGGFFLFTNVILFQSIHFDTIRPLTVVECIYFMAQIVTTIGYGDIGPAKTRGQIFVGFYAIFALFVICLMIEDLCEHLVRAYKTYVKKFKDQESIESARSNTIQTLIAPPRPSAKSFLTAMAAFVLIDIVFVVFFSQYPGEGKTVFQALYMSLITLGSIGFGFFTPVTEVGMLFGSFSMVLGCAAMVVAMGEFGALVFQLNEFERFGKMEKAEAKLAGRPSEVMKTLTSVLNGSDTVTDVQFLQFILVQKNKVSSDEVDDILKVFQNFRPKNGTVNVADIRKTWEDIEEWPESARFDWQESLPMQGRPSLIR